MKKVKSHYLHNVLEDAALRGQKARPKNRARGPKRGSKRA